MVPLADNVSVIKVFVSSPGDVNEERSIVGEVLDAINRTDGMRLGVRLEEFRWQLNVVPQIGPPAQEVIDEQTPKYGIYLGIMGARFGTPTDRYGSGTEQEFRDAFARWSVHGTPWITFYFRDQPIQPRGSAAAQQYANVAKFREELEHLGLVRSYSELRGGPACFKELLEQDLRGIIAIIDKSERKTPWMLFTSASPRRRQLLEQIGLRKGEDFVMEAVSVPPPGPPGDLDLEAARDQTIQTARAKIRFAVGHLNAVVKYSLDHNRTLVVGADTVVFCDGAILDTPLPMALELAGPLDLLKARSTAISMLKQQCGKTIYVITGLVVALAENLSVERAVSVVTEAHMRNVKDDDVEQYVDATHPFDKAGGFGIQDQGVMLFESLKGSYANVVGLPTAELLDLLRNPAFGDRVRLPRVRPAAARRAGPTACAQADGYKDGVKPSLVSVGDINYDFIYDDLPENFFASLKAPGAKVSGVVRRAAGGTAVNFAKGARKAGFGRCTVVGVVGGDALGRMIEEELNNERIETVLPCDQRQMTSVAIVLRDRTQRDTSLTLTDARQALPAAVARRVEAVIQSTDVLYVSGYCLIDPNRMGTAQSMLKSARQAGALTVLDVVVGMNERMSFEDLVALCSEHGHSNVDVLVSELPEILGWLAIQAPGDDPLAAFNELQTKGGLHILRQHFKAVFLRTNTYSHELVSTRSAVTGPDELDYSREVRRLGYGDRLSSRHIYNYLSPRVLLASKSPQRLALMRQIIAPNKLVAVASQHTEESVPGESPEDRVKRLALSKAERVWKQGAFPATIEVIIGADTEAVILNQDGEDEVFSHPTTREEARTILERLAGHRFSVLTGIAIIGRKVGDPGSQRRPPVVECVQTEVWFRKLSPAEVNDYVATEEPFGRAGGFAIQGRGGLLVDHIEGSYSNVVGLPLERLCAILDECFGMPIWTINKVSDWRFAAPLERFRAQTA